MDTVEILHQFERATGKFARAAIEAAVAHREEIMPELLRILEDAVDRAPQIDAEGDYMAHLYAMFLLAQFRETRLTRLWSALPHFPATCWILSAATSLRKTSARFFHRYVVVGWRAFNL